MITQFLSELLKRGRPQPAEAGRFFATAPSMHYDSPLSVVEDARIRTTQKLRMLNDWETATLRSIDVAQREVEYAHRKTLDEIAAAKAALLRYSQ